MGLYPLLHLLVEVIGVSSIDYPGHHPAYPFLLIGIDRVNLVKEDLLIPL